MKTKKEIDKIQIFLKYGKTKIFPLIEYYLI